MINVFIVMWGYWIISSSLLLLEAANYNEVIANDVLPDYRTFYVCYDLKKKKSLG